MVLPELWAPGGFGYRAWAERAAAASTARSATAMSDAARDAGVVLHAGSIVERPADGEPAPTATDLWNTSLRLRRRTASLLATYRKIHRFGFGAGEPQLMEAGEDVVVVDLPSGAGGIRARRAVHLLRPALPRALPAAARRGRRGVPRAGGLAGGARARTGPCWAGPGPSRTSASSSPATPPAPTPATRWAAAARSSAPSGEVLAEAGTRRAGAQRRGRPGRHDLLPGEVPVLDDRRL